MRSLPGLSALTLLGALGACSTTHEFRVASVGDAEAAEASSSGSDPTTPPIVPGLAGPIAPPGTGGTGGLPGTGGPGSPGSSPPVIVVAGNVLLGPAGQLASGGVSVPGVGIATGTVSAVLLTTSQTVVQLADGASLLINGVGGMLGDTVSIDLAQGQVVGGPQALIGSTVPGVSTASGTTLAGAPATTISRSAGSIVSSPSVSLPVNAARVLTPAPGVTSVIKATPAPPALRVGL